MRDEELLLNRGYTGSFKIYPQELTAQSQSSWSSAVKKGRLFARYSAISDEETGSRREAPKDDVALASMHLPACCQRV